MCLLPLHWLTSRARTSNQCGVVCFWVRRQLAKWHSELANVFSHFGEPIMFEDWTNTQLCNVSVVYDVWHWHYTYMTLKWRWNDADITLTWHWHYTDMTLTWRWHDPDMMLTLHWHDTDNTLTLHWHDTDMTLTWHWHYTDIALTWHWHYTDMAPPPDLR